MKYKITGDNLQIVTVELEEGEKVYAEAGSMVYLSPNIKMEAKMRGGLLKAIGRKFAGETFFLTEFSPQGGKGFVGFAGNAPGTIKAIELDGSNEFIVQKDAFLCAEDGVELSIAFQRRLGAIFFGGEGFILERLKGKGLAFIHACGDFVEMELKEGEKIKVDTGSVVGWEGSVDYDIQRVKGIKTIFFGGEGLFLTTLTGPGKILLQSMTLHNLAMALAPFLPQQQTSGRSGVLGTFLDETLGR
ncbi:TIGR00266 family protein [Thermoplasmatales archaeon ex4484_30]|nr:MAG: TIGR00266 family protein [Thermoplasmata archaeon]OYT59576.1 MAG: TIGR00266 family protein [Thermoplasmatales archaeon ex4484_30]